MYFYALQVELQDVLQNTNSYEQIKDKESKSEQQIARIQLEFCCKEKKSVLVVSILAADNLPLRKDSTFGRKPEAFIRLRLLPTTYVFFYIYEVLFSLIFFHS